MKSKTCPHNGYCIPDDCELIAKKEPPLSKQETALSKRVQSQYNVQPKILQANNVFKCFLRRISHDESEH